MNQCLYRVISGKQARVYCRKYSYNRNAFAEQTDGQTDSKTSSSSSISCSNATYVLKFS
jgi:hypothetical protein